MEGRAASGKADKWQRADEFTLLCYRARELRFNGSSVCACQCGSPIVAAAKFMVARGDCSQHEGKDWKRADDTVECTMSDCMQLTLDCPAF